MNTVPGYVSTTMILKIGSVQSRRSIITYIFKLIFLKRSLKL